MSSVQAELVGWDDHVDSGDLEQFEENFFLILEFCKSLSSKGYETNTTWSFKFFCDVGASHPFASPRVLAQAGLGY